MQNVCAGSIPDKVLFDTNQLLQKAKSEEEIFSLTASQLMKLLNRSLIVYLEQNGGLGAEQVFGVDGETAQNIFSAPEERDAANWTFANKKRSGAGTDSYPDAKGLYLALRTGGGVFGVIGIDLSENRWMPLKTVCFFPFWAKVRWPSKPQKCAGKRAGNRAGKK